MKKEKVKNKREQNRKRREERRVTKKEKGRREYRGKIKHAGSECRKAQHP